MRNYSNYYCYSFSARRSTLFLKLALVMLHLIFIGLLFIFYGDFRDKIALHPWYAIFYSPFFSRINLVKYDYIVIYLDNCF